MSIVAFIRRCVAAGMDYETALLAAEQIEADPPKSAAAIRQARYRHNKASRVTPVTPPSPKDLPESSSNPSLDQNPNPPPYRPPALGFAEFWLSYPNKVGKRAAETAWQRATKRADATVILAGLERAKRSRQWTDGYIPHPTTWLNQDRWEDEPDETPRSLQPTAGMVAAAEEELGFRRAMERFNGHGDGNRLGDQGPIGALPAPPLVGSRTRPLDH